MHPLLIACFLFSGSASEDPHLYRNNLMTIGEKQGVREKTDSSNGFGLSLAQPSGKNLDQAVHIQVTQLKPFQEIELRAEAVDQKGVIWTSHAFFHANDQGIVEVDSSLPLTQSSYEKVDGMGLFWSMLPASGEASSEFKCVDDTVTAHIGLYVSGELVARETVVRYLKSKEVQRIEVKEKGLVGVLFLPPSKDPLPVIVTLSGSNGGLSENRAKLLASNGFAVLALGYFGLEGLPPKLREIPLEYFETALSWIKKQPEIDGSHVGLYGVSRGAELSLLLGTVFPDSVQAIVAVVPSSVVYGGRSETPSHAWLYRGEPVLPFAPMTQTDFSNEIGKSIDKPANTLVGFLEGMRETAAFAAASIPVETIQCPILLISGGDDQMWPSQIYAEQILNRLQMHHSQVKIEHLNYPDAGHGINIPHLPIPEPTYYHPMSQLWFSMGGSREADAQASQEAWKHLVAFFEKTLKQPTD